MRLPRTVRAAFACGLAVVSSVVLLSLPASASIMRFLSIEELGGRSTEVVRARITGQTVHWTANHEGIYTEVNAVVTGDIKGAPGRPAAPGGAGRRVTIIQAGGEIDGVSLDWSGRPTFSPGEDLVLFLRPYDETNQADPRLLVVGGKQGRMRVVSDPNGGSEMMVERDLVGVLDAPFIEGDEPIGPAPRRDLVSLEELSRRVRPAGGPR
ncbi:MAG TPA: hypothetical protein VGK94_05470 [Candidatus Polarisedimenticolia bacterium]|jgi:hypothetical protein